jgi:Uma2 family endonuclease
MSVALLQEPPLVPPSDLGPYRLADYESLPDEPRCELLFGRLYVSPSPSLLHQVVVSLLWRALHDTARAAGGRAFLAPLDIVMVDHSVVQPDVVYLSPEAVAMAQKSRIEGVPDLLVEVLSPGTARRDRGEKLLLYAQSGVREYWIVDPVERQIEFLVNKSGEFTVALPEAGEHRSPVLPGLHLDIVDLWRQVDLDLG